MPLRPKFITFDCYGTLTNFRMGPVAREHFAGRVPAGRMDAFLQDFSAYRMDEVLGAWKPYAEVLENAIRRTCRKHGISSQEGDGRVFYDAVPGWGPHPDVPAALTRVAREFPLVILSNAANEQIHRNVALLEAPFHAVFTAEQAQAYKPRMQAFEHMLDQLGARPEELLHVSSSFRYDLMTAHDLGIRDKAWVNRGHEPRGNAFYGFHEIPDIGGLPGLLGL
ncbi:haloacid dehalogenase type II [Pseudoroseomonas rhizosphaerae]|uniref:Haloacid dehalogenase type II n=1 Tax=Teichococcus rhizosphaerae TaxID=1335062 RepID=A0A2C7AC37_9PROT|nr:haloacid dehalogenase type II [Pseudoroseomonas rhizosphaerae]PHK94217.1 haloacid dehalogenase type II [Pseudoroseomonas rhizosphaerae]